MNQSCIPDRLPPQSLDAEQAVLGAAMISQAATDTLLADTQPGHFYIQAHERIWEAIEYLREKDLPVDVLTVPEELRRRGQLDQIGGIAYTNTLAESVPTAAHQKAYCHAVAEKWQLRDLLDVGQWIERAAYDQELTPGEIIEQAIARFAAQELNATEDDELTGEELFAERQQSIDDGAPPDYLPVKIEAIDRVVRVFTGDLVLVAGRPSMGKTAFMLKLTFQWLVQGIGVSVFTLEMKTQQIGDRMISLMSGIPLRNIQDKRLTEEEKYLHEQATAFLGALPVIFIHRSVMTVAAIRAKLIRHKKENGTRVVIIDQLSYLQAARRHNSKNDELGEIVRAVRAVGQDLGLRVFLLCQLSRKVEERQDKRPMLSDLRDSGNLEQDADGVLLLFRKNYYDYLGKKEPSFGEMEVSAAKGRGMGTGFLKLTYDRDTQQIEPIDDTGYAHEDPVAANGHCDPPPLAPGARELPLDMAADYAGCARHYAEDI